MRRYIQTILTLVFIATPGIALALAQAPFPSASKLQPIPAYVAPNISGNVNAKLRPSYDPVPESYTTSNDSADNAPQDAQAVAATPENAPKPGENNVLVWVLLGCIATVAIGGFFYVKSQND